MNRVHEYYHEMHKLYGDTFQANLFGTTYLITKDPALIHYVFAHRCDYCDMESEFGLQEVVPLATAIQRSTHLQDGTLHLCK